MRKESLFLTGLLFCLSWALPAQATVYTVNAAGGGNYTTISACAAVAVAGDTCQIYAGTYSGWSQSHNGSAGKPITFTANTGDTVKVSSGIAISGSSYITISYLTLQGTITASSSTNHCIIDHNTSTASEFFYIPYVTTPSAGAAYTSSDNVLSNNTTTGPNTNSIRVTIYGDRNRVENNDFGGSGDDCINVGGNNVVIRGNYCHDIDGSQSGGSNHIDFVQNIGGACPTLTQSLIENNIEKNCTNDGGNCHMVILRTNGGNGSCGYSDNVIIRYNYAYNMNGMGFDIGGVGDQVTNPHIYNNTLAISTGAPGSGPGGAAIFYSDSNNPSGVLGVMLNNVIYQTTTAGYSPIAGEKSTDTKFENGNLTYTSGASSFGSPYSTEATYSSLQSKNPLFANYPTDGTLQSGSPAKGAAVALTTVASSDTGSGTSLILNDARFFQPGWAGTQGDTIRIGAGTTAQITQVNYSTNTVTLASSITRTSGQPVYLFKDSNGRALINEGSNLDIGAYPYQIIQPASATKLVAVPAAQ